MNVIGGLDVSKNHFALILKCTETNEIKIFVGWHNKKAIEKWKIKKEVLNWSYEFYYLPLKDKSICEDKENYAQRATDNLKEAIFKSIKLFIAQINSFPVQIIVSLEGYAMRGSMVVDLAEITGVIKHLLYKHLEIPFRTHDPLSVKMWAGSGNYDKEQMLIAVNNRVHIPEELTKTKNNPGSDVADAYFLMSMLETEIAVRKDPLYLKNLNEKKLQVFNRCTKAFPENLLNRPFVAIKQPELI